jgi:hypothetical protein
VALTATEARRVRDFVDDPVNGLILEQVIELAKVTYRDWDGETASLAERHYRDFLWVCWNYDRDGESLAAISILADKVWHCHMLLPAKYRDDCEQIFGQGHILDHTPILPGGQKVGTSDEAEARAEYAKLGVTLPKDLRDQCVWAVVGP